MASSLPTFVSALSSLFLTLSSVDQASTSDYLPPILTQSVAVVIPALGQEVETGTDSFSSNPTYETFRVRAEFWVKHTGDNSTLTTRARAISIEALDLLWKNPTITGSVSTLGWYDPPVFDMTMKSEVSDQLVVVGNSTYLPVVVFVTATTFFT
jgi:hypothetical protein